MKYVLIIMLFGHCQSVTQVEYSNLSACTVAMQDMQQKFDREHIDGSLSCLIKD